MKRLTFLFIIILLLTAGKISAQCVDTGGTVSAICQGGTSAALGGSFGGEATSAKWSDGGAGGSFSNNGGTTPGSATYTASATSTSPVTLTLTAHGGTCEGLTATKQIIVNSSPAANAGPAMSAICQSGTTIGLGGSYGGSATSAIWSDGGAGGSFSSNSGSTPGAATYTAITSTSPVTLTLTTGGGSCGPATASKQLTVNPLPVANSQTPAVCEDSYGSGSASGVNLTLLDNSITGGAGNRTVAWYTNAGHTSSVPTPSNVTVTNGNTFYVRVTNTITSCINYATVTYTVSPKPVASTVQITGTPADGATLTASYVYVQGGCSSELLSKTEISWYVADNSSGLNATWVATRTGTDKTYHITAADIGKYLQICVKVSDGTLPLAPSVCSPGWVGPVTANAKPVAGSVAVSGTTRVKRLLTGTYSYTDAEDDPEGASVYQWYTGDNSSGLNEQIITGAISISYLLTNNEFGKYIGFKVKPIAATGTTTGNTVASTAWAGPVTNDAPVATGVNITGTTKVGSFLTGHYTYSDSEADIEGASQYEWYTGTSSSGAGSAVIAGATSQFYQLTNLEYGKYIGFRVTPVAQTGTLSGTPVTTITWVGQVINPAPVASGPTITGTKNAGEALTGHYVYSDAEGDIENGSHFQWSSSNSEVGAYTIIPNDTLITHVIKSTEQGMYFKFSVTPKTLKGTTTGSTVTTPGGFGPANTQPSASALSITGTPVEVGTTLKAIFTYSDPDNDAKGATQFRWFRDGDLVAAGTDSTYHLTTADGGATMGVEVTPVSATGSPNTGDPVTCTMSATVDDPAGTKPEASNVCIEGKRMVDSVLIGTYIYTYSPRSEGTSWYKWYRNGVEISGATSRQYTVTTEDIKQDIVFEVTPRSSNKTPKVGTPARSNRLARITMDKTNFIETDRDTILAADPSGGYFWGEGVVNGKFSPKSVDYTKSPFTINYHYSDYTCGQDAISVVDVKGVTAYFQGFNTVYCQTGLQDTVYVKNIPSKFVYRHFIITDNNGFVMLVNDSTIIIDPSGMRAGQGQDWLIFWAEDSLRISYLQIQLPFDIEPIQPVTISLKDSSVFCNNEKKVELFVNQTGGDFDGPVTAGFLDPSLVTGNTFVKYKYTSPRGFCADSVSVHVRINPVPVVSFAAADSCISNSLDTTKFINNSFYADSTYADPVSRWDWGFSDGGMTFPDTARNPGYLYKTGGFHKITLVATTINNCSAKDEETIEMGFRPTADFRWENECMHLNDYIYLFDSTSWSTQITSRTWNFFDGGSLDTLINTRYPMPGMNYPQKEVDTLNIEYTVNTKFRGCSDKIRKTIYLRPTISLAKDDYFENFESGNLTWVKAYDTLNTWAFGKPSRIVIDTAASGVNAWYTNFNQSNQKKEVSSIISPCFNFDSITRPMISLKLWTKFNRNWDGAALQYRIGDSKVGDKEDWQYVGSFEDGINWFNSTLIQGRPGGDQIGWTEGSELDKGWGEARHKLDDLVGKKDVKFRIVYGSNGTGYDNEGLAFDDIWIGRRTRGVLLEHFTNNPSEESSRATAMVSDLSNRWPEDIINIQYHTNFPYSDPYFNDNPGDASARLLFYGLSRAPYSFIDGGADKKNFATLFDYVLADLDSNDVNRRSLINPMFSISLHSTKSPGVIAVNGSMKALRDIDVTNITLYLAVTQKVSTGDQGGQHETQYYNVFRKFLPDAGGIAIKRTWSKFESDTITERSWVISNIPNAADIEVIAFLQNNITKEVYQAESVSQQDITVGISDVITGGKGFALYPNPASSKLTIAFERPVSAPADIRIFDFSGTIVRSYKTGAGGSDFVIDDLGLGNGIYLIRITSGGADSGYKKLIVSGR